MIKRIIYFLLFSATATLLQGQTTTQTYVSRNTDLQYEVHGQGAPIYILSGGPGLSPEFIRPVVDMLKDDFQCVVLHNRGTGKSREANIYEQFNINLLAADIMHLRRMLRHEQITLIAHSWAAILALRFTAIYPENVKKLVLIAPGSPDLKYLDNFSDNVFAGLSKEEQKRTRILRDSLEILSAKYKGNIEQPELLDMVFKVLNADKSGFFFDKELAQQLPDFSPEHLNIEVMLSINQDIRENIYDIADAVRGTDIPLLFIQGMQDPIGRENSKETLRLFPNKTEIWIPQCGHYPWLEHPAYFKSILRTHLLMK